jgi:hypothetical protein
MKFIVHDELNPPGFERLSGLLGKSIPGRTSTVSFAASAVFEATCITDIYPVLAIPKSAVVHRYQPGSLRAEGSDTPDTGSGEETP